MHVSFLAALDRWDFLVLWRQHTRNRRFMSEMWTLLLNGTMEPLLPFPSLHKRHIKKTRMKTHVWRCVVIRALE